jgi:hypothetical protein
MLRNPGLGGVGSYAHVLRFFWRQPSSYRSEGPGVISTPRYVHASVGAFSFSEEYPPFARMFGRVPRNDIRRHSAGTQFKPETPNNDPSFNQTTPARLPFPRTTVLRRNPRTTSELRMRGASINKLVGQLTLTDYSTNLGHQILLGI